ncbi:Glyoxalase/Bleomycin resistance protein/Dioxygenase superfamily protein [Nonomuraea maritima]|jgi:catechol 2,3-dioxygenase-like lactoylglutathione lyase family enzyme|uniref:Glyoxalase/Bleomycin resistance protein/Dioxygenase superfamily protein n=1 Tax=Nonomuraea maritima TaxID=683260 RepID=A0A1G9AFZ3_9ACTN|nr:VOC family protein [Nonomuraea maritima]SDK25435.1 Glyoxalase/Bleomycin resistance protein/Dioxygenase superfamily protein [Nonomuraea maritima]
MAATLNGFHHVKLPVADVERSRDWYERVLGLRVFIEFVEDGELMGVALRDANNVVDVALRQDPVRAAAMAGFDPMALCVPTLRDLKAWQQRLDDLSEPHGGIVTGHVGQVLVGLHDPDGIEIRFYHPAQDDPEDAR